MNSFATPEWDSNPIADKTCNELFKVHKGLVNQKKNKKKGNNKSKKSEIKTGRIEKAKTKQNQKNAARIKPAKETFNPSRNKFESSKNNAKNNKKQKNKSSSLSETNKGGMENKRVKKQNNKSPSLSQTNKEEIENNRIKKQKRKITHQTLFNQTPRRNRKQPNQQQVNVTKNIPKLNEQLLSKKKLKRLKKKQFKANQEESIEEQYDTSILNKNLMKKSKGKLLHKIKSTLEESKSTTLKLLNKKQKAALPLRERMLEKLKGARFRYLNEQMYTTEGKDAKKYFENDQDAYQAYHEGYKQQVAQWPLNPVDIIIEKIKKLSKAYIIADFGCGEAKLAKSVPQKVHSFDLVAVDDLVTACDMAHVPLTDNSVDVVVFCLSLMGTNLKDYLLEANRVLKIGGLLKIAEVESRFDNVDDFVKNVQNFGFTKTGKDLTHDLFCSLDFVKKETKVKQKKKLPNVSLNPCLYKKR